MTKKILVAAGILATAGFAASSSAIAAGAGASARANLHIPVKSLAKTVALRPPGIRRTLRARGYYKIHFTDRYLPIYKVRACKNGKRFNLRLNRWGDIRRRTKIGWCDNGRHGPRIAGLSLPEIRYKLRNRNYRNIHFTDRRLPGYRARACKNGKRYVLWLNRWGKVRDRERRGYCGDRYYSNHKVPYRKHRHGPYIRYDGPGVSVTLGNRRYRY